jgi:16S rRNA (guanine527-N7)-methyltransferase
LSGDAPGDIERLVRNAASLGVALSTADARRLMVLLDELALWNRRFNLTAITAPAAMVTHHLLDSLAISPELEGNRVADVGTGAGFPGLPLAVVNPSRHFTLIDSTAKKVRFVSHAVQLLGLGNVTPLHARVERMQVELPFDTIVARAFAPLPQLLEKVAPLGGERTRVLAMKGKCPAAELAAIGPGWRMIASRELHIPGLAAARCVITLGAEPPR